MMSMELYKRQSHHQLIRVIENDKKFRFLIFGDDDSSQSVINLNFPNRLIAVYTQYCMLGLCALPDIPKRTLVIGLGGGSMPRFLRRHFPAMSIDVVELDDSIESIASEFFHFKTDANLRVIVDDALNFLKSGDDQYDFIIVDAFAKGETPFHLTTQDFFSLLRARLHPKGVLSLNMFSFEINYHFFAELKTIQSEFINMLCFQVPQRANNVILASRQGELLEGAMQQRAKAIMKAPNIGLNLTSMLSQKLSLSILQKEIDACQVIKALDN